MDFKKWESISEIGRAVEKPTWSIFTFFIWWNRSRERYMSKIVLSLFEREEISRRLVANLSICIIAKKLKRVPSTIFREINKNGGLRKYMVIYMCL